RGGGVDHQPLLHFDPMNRVSVCGRRGLMSGSNAAEEVLFPLLRSALDDGQLLELAERVQAAGYSAPAPDPTRGRAGRM
ncbi:MAG: hypothetical protein ACRDKW_02105, partial [Actinomycetota bacterium]